MNSAYPTLPLEELLFVPLKNGLTRPKSVRGRGYPMVNMGELFAYERIDENVSMDLVPMSECEAKSFSVLKGDLLFARQSLVLSGAGKCSYIKNLKQTTTFESHIIRARIDQSKASPLFYYYFFRSPQGKQTILSIVEQVAAAGIRGSDLKRLQVPVPPLPEQRSIAAILSALDDKIELNRQMIKTLEEMAQAIFKEWFVDFGPFRDDGMQDSELGQIPIGWRVGKLGELSTLSTISSNPAKSPDEEYWHYSIPAYDAGKRPVSDKGQSIKSNKYVVDSLCILVSKLNPEIKRIWRPSHDQTAICSTEFMVFRPISVVHKEFVYSLLDSDSFFSFLVAHASGSTGSRQRVRPGDSLNYLLTIPPDDIICSFASIVAPLHELIQNNVDNSATLAKTRDTLLPKLMSGELRVPVDEDPA